MRTCITDFVSHPNFSSLQALLTSPHNLTRTLTAERDDLVARADLRWQVHGDRHVPRTAKVYCVHLGPGRRDNHIARPHILPPMRNVTRAGQHHPKCDPIRIDEAPRSNCPMQTALRSLRGRRWQRARGSPCCLPTLSCTMSTSEPRVHSRSSWGHWIRLTSLERVL
jgi:hypothetical protein